MLSSVLAFTAIAATVVLMPGVDTILVLRTSLREGARYGIIVALGIVCGPVVWGALAGLGVALIMNQNPPVYSAVAAAGGLYLGYLAFLTLRGAAAAWRSPDAADFTAESEGGPRGTASHFLTGLMTNLLNPKIGVFYVSVMPGLFLGQHIDVWLGALLGFIHSVLGIAFLSAVSVLSALAARYLKQARANAVIDLVCGLCLLAFGAYVLVQAALHLA